MKLYLQIFILFMVGSWLQAQSLQLFSVEKLELKHEQYPWGDELYINVKGEALEVLDRGFLTISMFYRDRRVRWVNIPLVKRGRQKKILFEKNWGPLNRATEEILAGQYTVKVEFILSSQPRWLSDLLRRRPELKQLAAHEKDFYLGTQEQYRREDQNLKNVYLQNMKDLNQFVVALFRKKREALSVERDAQAQIKNSFGTEFTSAKWWSWYNAEFFSKVKQTKELLQKHSKQFIALRYPQTCRNMILYCDSLLEIGQRYTTTLIQYYKTVKINPQAKYAEPYNYKAHRRNMEYIRNLHMEAQKELEIDIKRELGFMPPDFS